MPQLVALLHQIICNLILQPNPKNPIIASFFRTIGLADNLGSGTRKLFKYSRYYSGSDPELIENDIFRINVPLNDDFSYDYSVEIATSDKGKLTGDKGKLTSDKTAFTANEQRLIIQLKENSLLTQKELAIKLGLSDSGVRYIMNRLKAKGIIKRYGTKKNGSWIINMNEEK